MDFYLATGNANKVEELAQLLRGLPVQVRGAEELGGMPSVEESGGTFAANAALKARALAPLAPEGSWVMADDSGLCVDALGGKPGVHSARYAGPEADAVANNALLLRELESVEEPGRSAEFVCVLCLVPGGGGEPEYLQGTCRGQILKVPRGGGGFGYDPLFLPEGARQTFAEMGDAAKHSRSHRGVAVRQLRSWLSSR